jgi:hypothetical protein
MSSAETTTDHDTIKKWIEDRDGRPAIVKSTGDNGREGGLLRVDFREPEAEFEEIGWDEFFKIFDDNKLAFLHQDETDSGGKSRFNKFVERETT